MLDIGYKNILKVALPMMLSGFIQSIINITDAAFLGHYSQLAFNAAGGAGMWYITLYMLFVGLNDGSQILMAQKIGEQNNSGVAKVFHNNIVLLTISAILATLFIQFAMPSILHSMVTDPVLERAELRFLEIRGFALWPTIITLSIQANYLAQGKSTLVMFTSLITAISNVFLAYCMVYGKFGFPEWGMEGAAIANTTAETLSMLFILGTLVYSRKTDLYKVWSRLKIDGKQLLENLKVGFPLCLQGLLALSVWTVFFNWIEQMGKEDLSVSLNIRHIYFLAFVPIWGFAAATKTYIAQYIGARELDKLPVIQRRIQLMTVLFLLVTFHGAVLYPEALISMINENEEFVQKSAVILRLVAGSIVLYAIVSVYFQTIGASGNTRVTFLVECLSTFSYLFAAWLFIKQWHWDITYVWLVEYVYFIVMGAASIIYLKFFNWTKTELA